MEHVINQLESQIKFTAMLLNLIFGNTANVDHKSLVQIPRIFIKCSTDYRCLHYKIWRCTPSSEPYRSVNCKRVFDEIDSYGTNDILVRYIGIYGTVPVQFLKG